MRRRLWALAVAVLSLAALALVRGGGGGPPLFDGLCLPPHYRLLGHTPPPPSASAVYTAADLGQTQTLADDQNAPQAQIIIGAGTFAPASGSSAVTLTITAMPPPAVHPAGIIDGNVYDIEATSTGRAVPAAPDHPVTIALGSTATGGPTLTLEHLTGGRWTALKTFQSGCGSTFDAASPSLGLFALVAQGAAGPANANGTTSSGGSEAPVLIAVVVALLLLAGMLAVVRTSRRHR